MVWVLKNVFGDESIQIKMIDNEFLIGRTHTMGLVCRSIVVSRQQAVIRQEEGNLILMDLESANGTYVNDVLLTKDERYILKNLDEIGFGLCRSKILSTNNPPFYIYKLQRLSSVEPIEISDDESEPLSPEETLENPAKKAKMDESFERDLVTPTLDRTVSSSTNCKANAENPNITSEQPKSINLESHHILTRKTEPSGSKLNAIQLDQPNISMSEQHKEIKSKKHVTDINEPCGSKALPNIIELGPKMCTGIIESGEHIDMKSKRCATLKDTNEPSGSKALPTVIELEPKMCTDLNESDQHKYLKSKRHATLKDTNEPSGSKASPNVIESGPKMCTSINESGEHKDMKSKRHPTLKDTNEPSGSKYLSNGIELEPKSCYKLVDNTNIKESELPKVVKQERLNTSIKETNKPTLSKTLPKLINPEDKCCKKNLTKMSESSAQTAENISEISQTLEKHCVKTEVVEIEETVIQNLHDPSYSEIQSLPSCSNNVHNIPTKLEKDCNNSLIKSYNRFENNKSTSSNSSAKRKHSLEEESDIIEITNIDHIITIDDEEEDSYNIVCSQMFIKEEPSEAEEQEEQRNSPSDEHQHEGITDQIFENIKREVEMMDRLELDQIPLITLDESMDWCFDDTDTDTSNETINTSANQSSNNIQPDDFNTNINIEESIDMIHSTNTNKDSNLSDDSCSSSPLLRIDESKSASPGPKEADAITPPIFKVPAVTPLKQNPRKLKTIKDLPKKQTSKKEPPKPKPKKKSPKKKQCDILDSSSKKEIMEKRREKLKEIAAKKLVEKSSSYLTDSTSMPNDVQEDQNCRPSRFNRSSDYQRISRVPSSKIQKIPKNLIEPLPQRSCRNKSNQENKINNFNRRKNDPRSSASCDDNLRKMVLTKEPAERTNTARNCKGNNFQRPSTSHQNMGHYNTLNKDPRAGYDNRNTYRDGWKPRKWFEENMDIVLTTLHWRTGWLTSEGRLKVLPAVSRKPPIRMCNTFLTYRDYVEVLQPLIISELWFNVCKEYESTKFLQSSTTNGAGFICNILDVKKHTDFVELRCISYLDRHKRERQLYPQEKSLLTLQYVSKSQKSKQTNTYVMIFGVVMSTKLEPLRSTDVIDSQMAKYCKPAAETKIEFTVIIKDVDDVLLQYHVYGRIYNSLSQYLRLFSSLKSTATSPLQNYILEPELVDYRMPYVPTKELMTKMHLNSSQREAVFNAVNLSMRRMPGLYLIEGPPGTGKSTVILNILMELMLQQNKNENGCILLLTPSNAAIDSLVLRVNNYRNTLPDEEKRKIKMVRIGNKNSMCPKVVHSTVEELARCNVNKQFFHDNPATKRDFQILEAEVVELHKRMQTSPTEELRKQHHEKYYQVENFAKTYLKSRYQDVFEQNKRIILQRANLICSTIGSCSRILASGLNPENIKLCIIDEATQSSESETLIPIGMGIKKLVLVGDPQQLPAMTSSILTKEFGYGNSLFSRIKHTLSKTPQNPIKMLNVQYRMNPEISLFPNNTYYKGLVKNGENFKPKPGLEKLIPYMVFNQSSPNRNQYYNSSEVMLVRKLLDAIFEVTKNSCKGLTVGIITPYSDQRDAINHSLRNKNFGDKVTCNTVDSFQGQEKDIILLSCVRDSSNSFLSDEHRLTVAITRAKYALYIIGTHSLFESCLPLKKLKNDAEKRNLYVNVTRCIQSATAFATLISKR